MLKNQKGFFNLVLLILFLIAMVIVLGTAAFKNYFQPKDVKEKQVTFSPSSAAKIQIMPSPTPQDTEDPERKGWKLYKNSEANYQISYPGDWTKNIVYNYYDPDDDLGVMSQEHAKELRGLGFLDNEIQLSVGGLKATDPTSKSNLEELNKALEKGKYIFPPNKVGGVETKVEDLTIAGHDAAKLIYKENYEGSIYGILYHIRGEGNIPAYYINFFAKDETSIQYHEKEITEILASFKISAFN